MYCSLSRYVLLGDGCFTTISTGMTRLLPEVYMTSGFVGYCSFAFTIFSHHRSYLIIEDDSPANTYYTQLWSQISHLDRWLSDHLGKWR
jgi:hypothetical protein